MITNYNGWYIQPCNLQLLHKKPFRLLFLSQGESEDLRIIFFRGLLSSALNKVLFPETPLWSNLYLARAHITTIFLLGTGKGKRKVKKLISIIFSNLCSCWITINLKKGLFSVEIKFWKVFPQNSKNLEQNSQTASIFCTKYVNFLHQMRPPRKWEMLTQVGCLNQLFQTWVQNSKYIPLHQISAINLLQFYIQNQNWLNIDCNNMN